MSTEKEASTSTAKPKLSFTACFDALWFCYSPVYQMQQYYRVGKLDNCSGKWTAMVDCLLLKTKSASKVEDVLMVFSDGPIYSDRERLQIYVSDAGVLAICYGLYLLARVVCVYGVPLLVVNGFLVLITYLQHTHPALPHYDSSEWDWFRGALATMDRDYGILNKVFHNITDTHVAHTMPHYHAMEATKAIKPVLGEYYRFDETTPFYYKALWREARECIYVEPDQSTANKGVFWYKNKL